MIQKIDLYSQISNKLADTKSVFRKERRNEKKNYRPVTMLSNVTKIYEKCLYKRNN